MKTNTFFSLPSSKLSGIAIRIRAVVDAFFKQRPATVYFLMLALLGCSGLLCFTLLRSPAEKGQSIAGFPGQATQQVSGVYQAAGQLSQVLSMQAELKGMLGKKSLDHTDSLRIHQMIEKIKSLQIKNYRHEKNQP
ncbi:hypothetical protein ASE74_04135 [Pedobacter sp. Leaf216]|uniref:hypothetical protein n=1 Tax=Pedobacter sp. Leaf216 TaxID=1735684 RepID=UPI0006FA921A|nr:hypothetical protein [Pedobacter sp. Leaf216]KQM69209.1 hypothetical protein ASE74_04135 [Pedobacter sp. Leaf216]